MLYSTNSSLLVIIVALLLLGCAQENNVDNSATEELALQQRLQAILDSKVGPGQLQGVSISIRVGEEEKWNLVSGLSKEGELITKNMRFGIASITKTAIAATILKLEEEGLLSLDDPISKWLTFSTENVDESITIFQLLNHLSGVEGYFKHEDIWPMVENNLDQPISPEQLVDFIGTPLFEAGERFEYSNSNYLLLGLIIKVVTNQEVGEVMRQKFWIPLNLSHIYFGGEEPPTGPIAAPWRDGNGDGMLEDISGDYQAAYYSVFWTAAAIFSTAEDLSMWAYQLYKGNALSEVSKAKMLDFLFIDGFNGWDGYGLGVRRVNIAGRQAWGHTGGMRGYGSYMLYEPNSTISIAMLNNQSRSTNGPALRYELVNELLTELFK